VESQFSVLRLHIFDFLTAGCVAAHLAGWEEAEVHTAGGIAGTASLFAGTAARASGLAGFIASSLTLCKTEDLLRRHCSTHGLVAATLYGGQGRSNDAQGTEDDEMHLERRIMGIDRTDLENRKS